MDSKATYKRWKDDDAALYPHPAGSRPREGAAEIGRRQRPAMSPGDGVRNMGRGLASKDFLAGILFVAFGLLGVWLARALPAGTASAMEAGYFPRLVCGLLIAIGGAPGDRRAGRRQRASRTGTLAADRISSRSPCSHSRCCSSRWAWS